MMNASADITSNYGRHLQIASIHYLWVRSCSVMVCISCITELYPVKILLTGPNKKAFVSNKLDTVIIVRF